MGLIEWVYGDQSSNTTSYHFKCLKHECACSARDLTRHSQYRGASVAAQVTSNITVNGKAWELAAPPLNIGLASAYAAPSVYHEHWKHYNNASDFWFDGLAYASNNSIKFTNYSEITYPSIYLINDTQIDEKTIKRTGRCIADDAYSWGFSSLILLTSCCYTILFSLMLILLQTDVYWNSRHDRDFQYHSIYTDILYLAEELKATFGDSVKDHLQSPLAFEKRVETYKQGLRLDVHDLPLSRWQEWRLSRATKRADRKGTDATKQHANSPAHELHPLDSQNDFQLGSPAPADREDDPGDEAPSRLGLARDSSRRGTAEEQSLSSLAVSESAEESAFEEQGLIANAARTGVGRRTGDFGTGEGASTSRQDRG